jgi:hypothetical protein
MERTANVMSAIGGNIKASSVLILGLQRGATRLLSSNAKMGWTRPVAHLQRSARFVDPVFL